MKVKVLWRWWAKALGQKAVDNDRESDYVAVIRTILFSTYLVTNLFIVAGVIRHWNGSKVYIIVPVEQQSHQMPQIPPNVL